MNRSKEAEFRQDFASRPKYRGLEGEEFEKKLYEVARNKVVCVKAKETRKEIVGRFMVHLHFHPFVCQPRGAQALRSVEEVNHDLKETWKAQVEEMHNICLQHGESWAWEYLWKNWYHPDKYPIWARAVCDEIPIINSNSIVESVWSVLKKNYLRQHHRPKLEFLVDIIMNQYLPNNIGQVNQHRHFTGPVKPSWYILFHVPR